MAGLKDLLGMAAVVGGSYFLEPILGPIGGKITSKFGEGFISRVGKSLTDEPTRIQFPSAAATSTVGASYQERNFRALQGMDYLTKIQNSTYTLGRDNWSALMGAVQIDNILPKLGSREVTTTTTPEGTTTELATTARGY
tara:strand:+ start:1725 stop:2144 length:420 start_codon:yes stop_codon:yes gene_type:complete